MEPIPTYQEFWSWFALGAFVVPLVELLKRLPEPLGGFIDKVAWLLVPMLTTLAPVIAQTVLSYIPALDPMLWIGIYALVSYAASQLIYRVAKKTGLIA